MGNLGWLYKAVDGNPARIVEFLRWLAGQRGLADPVRVLDVGAGVGRMVGPLSALGWRVTATEPDPDYRQLLQTAAANVGATVTPEAFTTWRTTRSSRSPSPSTAPLRTCSRPPTGPTRSEGSTRRSNPVASSCSICRTFRGSSGTTVLRKRW